MATEFTVSAIIPAKPKEIYDAWLSSKGHALITGSPAKASARPNGAFTAWDGYIKGKNLKLKPGKLIVQSWRTTEFAAADEDSAIDITLEPVPGGTKITLRHTNIPGGQSDYRSGWHDCYFNPMKQYFSAAKKRA